MVASSTLISPASTSASKGARSRARLSMAYLAVTGLASRYRGNGASPAESGVIRPRGIEIQGGFFSIQLLIAVVKLLLLASFGSEQAVTVKAARQTSPFNLIQLSPVFCFPLRRLARSSAQFSRFVVPAAPLVSGALMGLSARFATGGPHANSYLPTTSRRSSASSQSANSWTRRDRCCRWG